MSKPPSARHRMAATLLGFGLLATACASGGSTPDNPAAAAASEAAAANINNLQQSSNVLDIELLDVTDGSVATLREAVDGDRPVLIWFWSPH